MAGQFEIFADGTEIRFRLTGPDGGVLAVSTAFGDKAAAVAAITAARENAAGGRILDRSCPPTGAGRVRGARPDRASRSAA
jgi:uncharacterized protein